MKGFFRTFLFELSAMMAIFKKTYSFNSFLKLSILSVLLHNISMEISELCTLVIPMQTFERCCLQKIEYVSVLLRRSWPNLACIFTCTGFLTAPAFVELGLNCPVRNFLCLQHWLLIEFNAIQIIHKSLCYFFFFFFFFFFKFFVWTKVHFVEPLIAPVLDFVCPSSWVSNPEWISCLHSFLLACCDPEGHVWCDTCLFHQ